LLSVTVFRIQGFYLYSEIGTISIIQKKILKNQDDSKSDDPCQFLQSCAEKLFVVNISDRVQNFNICTIAVSLQIPEQTIKRGESYIP